MFKGIKCLFCFFIVLYFSSCSDKYSSANIFFSTDSSSIIINNIDEASFLQIEKIYHANPDTINFLSILIIPDSTDKIQIEQKVKGEIKLKNKQIIFTPKLPFQKGKSYLVESYLNSKFISIKKMFENDAETHLKPQQQILTR